MSGRWTPPPFKLALGELGCFRRPEGLILWAGASRGGPELETLYRTLCGPLAGVGYVLESRGFTAHLTLARRAVPRESFAQLRSKVTLPPLTARVETLSLMKSERISGVLTYTEIGRSVLRGPQKL